MQPNIDGIYAGYFSAVGGNGLVLFIIRQGIIAGADLTSKYDGNYQWNEQKEEFEGSVNVRLNPGGMTIQGVPTGAQGLEYVLKLSLPLDFSQRPYITLSTPLGPVNARFEKIRGVE